MTPTQKGPIAVRHLGILLLAALFILGILVVPAYSGGDPPQVFSAPLPQNDRAMATQMPATRYQLAQETGRATLLPFCPHAALEGFPEPFISAPGTRR